MNKAFTLIVGLLIFLSFQGNAQTTNSAAAPAAFVPTPHIYYMYLSGINKGQDVEFLEDSIQKMPGVSYFLSNRFPPRYFLLKSKNPVTQADFASWIGNKYKIEFYGEGEQAKEGAVLVYYKTHKK